MEMRSQLTRLAQEAELNGRSDLALKLMEVANEFAPTPHVEERDKAIAEVFCKSYARGRLEKLGLAICHFCGAVDTLEGAMESGWVPNFWKVFPTCKPAEEVLNPVCANCVIKHLRQDDGEYVEYAV
jgi:hypothetical protein